MKEIMSNPRVRGRILINGYWVELSDQGLFVRKYHKPRKSGRWLPAEKVIALCKQQTELPF